MIPEDDYREWQKKTENDLLSANILANHYKPQIENSCYHCQQSAEKALKSFLVYHDVKFEYTQNLEKLCKDCQKIDPSFKTLYKYCKFMNDFITFTRYPSKVYVTEDDMRLAIKYAEKILNFVREKTK